MIERALIRKQRVPLADRQITAVGATGQAGIFCILYEDQADALTFDLRFFQWKQRKNRKGEALEQGRHRSTTNGVIFEGMHEAYAAAQALVDLIEVAKARIAAREAAAKLEAERKEPEPSKEE